MRDPGNLLEGGQDEGALPMRKIQADIFPHLKPLLFVQLEIDKTLQITQRNLGCPNFGRGDFITVVCPIRGRKI
jgi:hypothetical protein